MTNTYVDKSYAYAVARIRYAELKLFNEATIDQLISAKDSNEEVWMLRERGWGSNDSDDLDAMVREERRKLWEYIEEVVPDINVFNVLRYQNDYINLKGAIKATTMKHEYPGITLANGSVDPKLITEAVQSRNYKMLPVRMAEIAEKAHEIFLRTGDGQLCDIMVDKACLEAIREDGLASSDPFIQEYAELFVAGADIKVAIRACHTNKDRDFLEMAIAESGILSISGLINAALSGEDAIGAFLAATDFSGAVQALKKSAAAFQRYCDNLINDRMQKMHYESFGPGPIAAYIIAKEHEIRSVKIILAAKQNGFSNEMIRERMRDTYV